MFGKNNKYDGQRKEWLASDRGCLHIYLARTRCPRHGCTTPEDHVSKATAPLNSTKIKAQKSDTPLDRSRTAHDLLTLRTGPQLIDQPRAAGTYPRRLLPVERLA